MALTQGSVFGINSAKGFYRTNSGVGNVEKIFRAPISSMQNITLDGKRISQPMLREFIKKEKLGPEWGADWTPNQQGIMQLTNPRTYEDLIEFSTGPHLAHLHPNTTEPHIIKFDYKLAGDVKNRTGFAQLSPKAPVDGLDLSEGAKWGRQFPKNQWNTVLEKNGMWFYNGTYNSLNISFR